MRTDNLTGFSEETLNRLSDKLNNEYYNSLTEMLQRAERYAQRLKETDGHNIFSDYINACRKLLYQLNIFLQHRRNVLTPYISELAMKNKEGHDCSTCSGACDVGHATHITEVQASQMQMKELLYNVDKMSMQYSLKQECGIEYKMLKEEMTLIHISLNELFYVEEMHLLRKILEGQQAIYIRK